MASKQSDLGKASSMQVEPAIPPPDSSPFRKIIIVSSIAAGVQFGWALQLSLLTPYVQLLGVPHTWAAFIWLCGPISGLVVQPIVGYYSDRCTSRFGRRRPFIAAGSLAVALAVFFIGYAADIGHMAGDSLEKKVRPRAVTIFVIGFWILDVANNMLQGPCRALLGDLAAGDAGKTRTANSFYSFFMAIGNVLGYAAGSYSKLHNIFPFSETRACDVYCANLKSCFFISIALLAIVSITALCLVKEKPWDKGSSENDLAGEGSGEPACFGEIASAFHELKRPMWMLLLVTCINWIAWFPFILFDTDWMGKEVYGGTVGEGKAYDRGVRAGALGLMINSIVLGVVSLGVEPMGRLLGGVKNLWGVVNVILAIGLGLMLLVSKLATHTRSYPPGSTDPLPPPTGIKVGALAIFALLGIPLAINYSVPFALASIISSSSGGGQGLSLGVLNLAIVIPQMFVSVISGPWDALFGGGNLPAFVLGAAAALISGVLAIVLLPKQNTDTATKSFTTSGSFH